ncbi:MAG: aminopeptidase P family protein [Clostridiaceae bacterium]|nr:aminopeptidase P family protein [Clostridiaceae bacterium]
MSAPTAGELLERQHRLWQACQDVLPGLDSLLIINKVNQFYLTGTMQDGLLVLRPDGLVRYFVRKSATRARRECPLDIVVPVNSYRDMLTVLAQDLGHVGLELETMTLAACERIRKYFRFERQSGIDRIILDLRAVKSSSELLVVAESGRQHARLLNELVPGMLREGMSETDFLAELYAAMVKLGYQGVSRFAMPQMEMIVGQLGFGTNAIYPTNFNGPGGMRGMSPAVPIVGDRHRRLGRGDLVFVDVGYGVDGYHSDKTQVYCFGGEPSARARSVHQACRDVLANLVSGLKPGAIPARLYAQALKDLPDVLQDHFMGYPDDPVRFLGHGVGLQIDEMPVIAAGFGQPLQAGMVVALEPKCAVPGEGMVGVEETYQITATGCRCLTGGDLPIRILA